MRTLVAVGLLTGFGISSVAQSLAPVAEIAHPNAKVLLGIEVRRLRESSVGQSTEKLWTGQLQSASLASKSIRVPGIEFLEDIDRVFISSPGMRTPSAKPVAVANRSAQAPKQDPLFLAVLQGSFPPAHYQPLLQGPKRTYRGVAMHKASKTGDTTIAVVDEHTLLIGDEKSVFGALDRRGRGAQESALLTRAATLAGASDLWFVVADLASGLPPAEAGGPAAMAAQFTSQVETLEMGLSVQEGLKLEVNLGTKSDATAQLFAGLLTTQLEAAAAQPGNTQAVEMLKKIQVGTQGNRLSLNVSLSKDELEQQIQLAQAARFKPQARRSANSAVRPSTGSLTPQSEPISSQPSSEKAKPAEPQAPRKVRIFGLDDGVREIALDR